MVSLAGSAFQEEILYAFGGGDPRITIAVLDGPVDRTHDCFRGARLTPVDTAQTKAANSRATAHGTHVASLIFGQPCSSVEGIAPLCRGLIVPIFGQHASCSQQELALAILLALDQGAHVINIGMGRFAPTLEPDLILAEALDRCRRRNVLIVAGSGESDADLSQAITLPTLLRVYATDACGRPLRGENPRGGTNDGLWIPGSEVMGAALEGGVAHRSGADCAAALTSGIVGLLLGAQLRNGFPANPHAAREALLKSATPRPSSRKGAPVTGREQIQASLDRMLGQRGANRGAATSPFHASGTTATGLDGRG